MNGADHQLTAADRMSLTPVIGREGMAALDRLLSRLRGGERPDKRDVIAFARALHENDVIDFSEWPEFRKRRHCGSGHPSSGVMSTLRPRD